MWNIRSCSILTIIVVLCTSYCRSPRPVFLVICLPAASFFVSCWFLVCSLSIVIPCLHDTTGCQTGLTTSWMFVYMIQPVVQLVVKSVWQPFVSCIQTFSRLSNQFDSRLYRVNGATCCTNDQEQQTRVTLPPTSTFTQTENVELFSYFCPKWVNVLCSFYRTFRPVCICKVFKKPV